MHPALGHHSLRRPDWGNRSVDPVASLLSNLRLRRRYGGFFFGRPTEVSKLRTATGYDDDRPQHRTEPGGWVITTAGVRLNDEGKGQIDGAKVFGRSCTAEAAGKLVSAADSFTGTRQNDSVPTVSKGSSGECWLSLIGLRHR